MARGTLLLVTTTLLLLAFTGCLDRPSVQEDVTTPTEAEAKAPSDPPALPPMDDHCQADTDCDVTDLQLEGEHICCQGCGLATAGRVEWVEKVQSECQVYLAVQNNCLPLACPAGPNKAACVEGRCVPTL